MHLCCYNFLKFFSLTLCITHQLVRSAVKKIEELEWQASLRKVGRVLVSTQRSPLITDEVSRDLKEEHPG